MKAEETVIENDVFYQHYVQNKRLGYVVVSSNFGQAKNYRYNIM
jgi:hypothetical protein